MAKAVTLSDIGKKLNVSTVTVSKALSGQKGVSDELRTEIVRLADEMGYIRKASGTEEEGRRSYNIGVIVAERYLKESQSFYWKIYQEISQRAMGGGRGMPKTDFIGREEGRRFCGNRNLPA